MGMRKSGDMGVSLPPTMRERKFLRLYDETGNIGASFVAIYGYINHPRATKLIEDNYEFLNNLVDEDLILASTRKKDLVAEYEDILYDRDGQKARDRIAAGKEISAILGFNKEVLTKQEINISYDA